MESEEGGSEESYHNYTYRLLTSAEKTFPRFGLSCLLQLCQQFCLCSARRNTLSP